MNKKLNIIYYSIWQYNIRQKNTESDLVEFNLTYDDVKDLRVDDFTFEFVPKDNKAVAQEIKKFIENSRNNNAKIIQEFVQIIKNKITN